MTATPEQDRPDRLPEIKQRAQRDERGARHHDASVILPWVGAALDDRAYLIVEVERLRAALDTQADVAHRLLGNVEQLADEHPDPGTEALAAIWEARQLLSGHAPPPDDLVERAAEAVAGALGHTLEWDTPEGPCCDNTLGCGGHEATPGCAECAAFGWPCETALNAAKAALSAAALALPAKDGARP